MIIRRSYMNFKPLGNRVLAKIPEEKTQTESGIYLPDTASKEKPTQAEVVAVGTEVKDIVVGNTVVYSKFAGTDIALDGVDYLILDCEKDILGILA
jgi:chaperonin GroES